MTRTEQRLAELSAIRDRALTEDEQCEVIRLAHLQRQCEARRRRYREDPEYRATLVQRSLSWRRASGRHLPRHVAAMLCQRDERGRFA
jgi:hypothetical protein